MFSNSPPGVNRAQNKTPFEPLNDFISSLGFEEAAAIKLMWVPLSPNSRCLWETGRVYELLDCYQPGPSRKLKVFAF